MTEVASLIVTARYDLRRLVDAWITAVNEFALGYGPDGIDYQPPPPRKTQDDDEDEDAQTDDLRPSMLSAAHSASVRELRHAVVASSELSWIPDDVAQTAVLPERERIDEKRRTAVPHRCGMAMAHEVNLALIGAQWRKQTDSLTFGDRVHLRVLARHVGAALSKMPRELWVPATDTSPDPDTKRCAGGPGRQECPNYVAWSGREHCDICGPRVDALTIEHPGHRHDPCRNPWDRKHCSGTVDVPKRSLCHSCDQFRRNALRQAAA